MKINTLLIGSGGREHSLAKTLAGSESCGELFANPGNPGIYKFAKKPAIQLNTQQEILDFCNNQSVALVVVGPEQPLAEGLADYLNENNIAVFGPDKFATQLESSKSFAKNIMLEANVPTANFESFNSNQLTEATKYINGLDYNVVIKADGLAGGKGVIIPTSKNLAIKAVKDIFEGKFGAAGNEIVIEEFMEGEEASVFAICDGSDFVTLAPSQDHKRVSDGDGGENTGGMGAYAPAPIVTPEVLEQVKREIIKPTLKAIRESGHPFIGCLYCGLMIKDSKAKVVEFNVRFGDPETQSVLSIFDGDLCGLFYSAAKGKLDKNYISNISKGYACNVVLASEGYPAKYEKGFEITGLNNAEKIAEIYHAGTKLENGKVITNGGRVLAVNGKGDSIKEAVDNAYEGVSKICFNNIYYRKDIGKKALN